MGWVLFRLRKLYGCAPSQLMDEDYDTIMGDLRLEQLERKVSRGG